MELFKNQDEIIDKEMKKFGLPPETKVFIENLLSGKADEDMLMCCHSDCAVCQQTIYECLQEIKKQLN